MLNLSEFPAICGRQVYPYELREETKEKDYYQTTLRISSMFCSGYNFEIAFCWTHCPTIRTFV